MVTDIKGMTQTGEQKTVSARIMRAARKMTGLTQQQVAQAIEVSQSALSKMEHGILVPDMFQWYDFCQLTRVDELSCKFGYIDSGNKLMLKHEVKEGGYHLPGKYAHHRGESVRSLLPFIEYMKGKIGEEGLKKYFKYVQMDQDFFVNYSAQVNFNFLADMAVVLTEKCGLKRETLSELVRPLREPEFHGKVAQSYEKARSPEKMVGLISRNMDRYQIDCEITVKDQKDDHIDVAVTPNYHMKQFSHREKDLGSFFCEYEQAWLKEMTSYDGLHGMKVHVLEESKDMTDQRIYRIAS